MLVTLVLWINWGLAEGYVFCWGPLGIYLGDFGGGLFYWDILVYFGLIFLIFDGILLAFYGVLEGVFCEEGGIFLLFEVVLGWDFFGYGLGLSIPKDMLCES